MLNKRYIIISIIFLLHLSFVYAWLPIKDIHSESDLLIEYKPYIPDVGIDISFSENMNLNKDDNLPGNVKGVQFDIAYDPDKLLFNELVSFIDGAVFEYSVLSNGRIRCIVFYLDGSSIGSSELSNLANLSLIQRGNFYDKTEVYLENVIIAGDYGKDVSSHFNYTSWSIDFINLKPLYTYIYTPEEVFFSDSIKISYQLHKEGRVKSELYDIFNQKIGTLVDKYMAIGRHSFTIDDYNQLDEKLDYGHYKVQFSTDYEYLDSIHVVYQKQGDLK